MSTLEREVVDADAPQPSTSLALVPLSGDREPRLATRTAGGPPNAHRYFYGLGYTALAFVALATWLQPARPQAAAFLYVLGAFGLATAGLAVVIHVVYRPRMQKLRMGLGAVASVVLTGVALDPIDHAAREVHAESLVVRLQPLADDLARSPHIRTLGLTPGGWVELGGQAGSLDGAMDTTRAGAPVIMAELLQREGVSRQEVERLMERMREAGVLRLEVREGYVAFANPNRATLLFARPGRTPPPPGTAILDVVRWRTQPLGGGWYLLRY